MPTSKDKEPSDNPFENANLPGRVPISIGKLIEKYEHEILTQIVVEKEQQALKKELGLKPNEDLIVSAEAVTAQGDGNIIGLNSDHFKALRVPFKLITEFLDPDNPHFATIEGITNEGKATDPIEVEIEYIYAKGRTPNQVAITQDIAKQIDTTGGIMIVEVFQRLENVTLGKK